MKRSAINLDAFMMDGEARFLYLGNCVDEKEMTGTKGHCFHYSKPNKKDIMTKEQKKVYGTYLHTFFRNHVMLLERYFFR